MCVNNYGNFWKSLRIGNHKLKNNIKRQILVMLLNKKGLNSKLQSEMDSPSLDKNSTINDTNFGENIFI